MASDYRGELCNVVAILFLGLTWTAVLLRVYVRAIITKSFWTDDWLAVLTLFLFTFYCAFVIDGVHYGTGRHLTEIGHGNFIISMKAWWIAELGYVSSTTTLKLSIGVYLLRLCVKKIHRIVIWVVLSAVTVFSLFYFFLIIFQCRPTSYFWNQYNPKVAGHGHCVGANMIAGSTYTHSGLSVVADWMLGILPVFLVWDLNMNPRTKVSVALILGLGAIGSTATIVRIPYIYQLTTTKDFLFANVDISIWSTVEPGIGITASALATLRPLFVSFFNRSRLLGSSTRDISSRWGPRSASKGGYFRSGGGNDNGAEELGLGSLRSDMQKGSGVTTVIHSLHEPRGSDDLNLGTQTHIRGGQKSSVDETIKRIQRFGSFRSGGNGDGHLNGRKGGSSEHWNSSESRLAEDSSSEEGIGVLQRPLEVTKTMEVVSMSEPRHEKSLEIGVAVSRGGGFG